MPENSSNKFLNLGSGSRLRTMKTDMEELFKKSRPSVAQVITQNALATPPLRRRSRRSLFIMLGIGALLILGGGAGYYFYPGTKTNIPTKPEAPSPLFATEATKTISAATDKRADFFKTLEDVSRASEREGTITRVVIALRDGPQERFATLADFFELYTINPPFGFTDRANSIFMPFFYHTATENHFGLAFQIKDADRATRDLLSWERTMFAELKSLFLDRKLDLAPGAFEDRTYRNIDWRYLKLSSTEDTGIAYLVFPAKNIVVITTSKRALETTINRLFNTQ